MLRKILPVARQVLIVETVQTTSVINISSQVHLNGSRTLSSLPSYVLNAPVTDVTKLDSGIRVASEVILFIFL